jgi:hypothetical protein
VLRWPTHPPSQNDEVYDALDRESAQYADAAAAGAGSRAPAAQPAAAAGQPLDLDKGRMARTDEDMTAEAAVLRALLAQAS